MVYDGGLRVSTRRTTQPNSTESMLTPFSTDFAEAAACDFGPGSSCRMHLGNMSMVLIGTATEPVSFRVRGEGLNVTKYFGVERETYTNGSLFGYRTTHLPIAPG